MFQLIKLISLQSQIKMKKEQMIALAQGQLDAYNNRDLEKFLSHYHPQVEVFRLNTGDCICNDFQTFTKIYKERFEQNPNLNCELKNRIVLENTVMDEEWVTGVTGATAPSHVVAVYAFADGLISKVWFVR